MATPVWAVAVAIRVAWIVAVAVIVAWIVAVAVIVVWTVAVAVRVGIGVLNEAQKLVGMVSLGDISHALSHDLTGEVTKAVSAHHN
jgi:hypothetical protein